MKSSVRIILLAAGLLLAAVQGMQAQFVTDVVVIGGSLSETSTQINEYGRQGYILINKDLNEGAGGAYIYLMYKNSGSNAPITDLHVRIRDNHDCPDTFTYEKRTYHRAPIDGNSGFKNSQGDLNYSAHGKFIYLYYSRDGYSPARAVSGITIDNSSQLAVGENGTAAAADLNKGAGGKFVYLHVAKSAAQDRIEVTTDAQLEEAAGLNGANIFLTQDITMRNRLDLPYLNHSFTIDLNGHTLNRGLRTSGGSDGHVLLVRGTTTLTVRDSGSNGTMTGGYANSGGAIWIDNGGTFILESGTIFNCYSTGAGAAICNNGTFIMKGGTIAECTASGDGGIYNNGVVTISGGTIRDCLSDDGGAIYNVEGKTVNITGGTFQRNSTITYGGGAITNKGTLNLSGGTFNGNYSKGNGGGIYQGGKLNLSGNPVISGNTKGSPSGNLNDVFLPTGKKAGVSGAFTEGAHIGLSMEVSSEVLSTGYAAHNPGADPANFFFIDADPEVYSVSLLDGELVRYEVVAAMETFYLDIDGNPVREPAARMVSALKDEKGVAMANGWYVVDKNTTIQNRIEIIGVVNLILADNTTLDARRGIHLPYASTLNIWAQQVDGEAPETGILKANTDVVQLNAAGIGENRSQNGERGERQGEINIHGGAVGACGSDNAPGIGGHMGKDITITGGAVVAMGGQQGAGIGCGAFSISPKNITITGGVVSAVGFYAAAGIGTGLGGRNFIPKENSTGIVPADGLHNVRITGGRVTALGGGAGIGGGHAMFSYEGCPGNVYIEGGTVIAETLVGAEQDPHHTEPQAIGHGGWYYTGGESAYFPMKGEFTVYDNAKVKAAKYNSNEQWVTAAERTTVFALSRVAIMPCDHPQGYLYPDGSCKLCKGGHQGLYLEDGADNNSLISSHSSQKADVTLSGRTFWKDGSWNTLCLPFDLSKLDGTPLEGATVRTLTAATVADGTVKLTFGPAVNAIEAGKPYIVKWEKGESIVEPVFKNVLMTSSTRPVNVSGVSFKGTYSPAALKTGDQTIIYIGAGDKLYIATDKNLKINSCRGYFVLDEGLETKAVKLEIE